MLIIKKNKEIYYKFKDREALLFSGCFSYPERQSLYQSLKTKQPIKEPESIKGFILVEE
jgi:hypothetical protein